MKKMILASLVIGLIALPSFAAKGKAVKKAAKPIAVKKAKSEKSVDLGYINEVPAAPSRKVSTATLIRSADRW
jgi:hypothetical protein